MRPKQVESTMAVNPNKTCSKHANSAALSHCHSCKKLFCNACLTEGLHFYYCSSPRCRSALKKELGSKKEPCTNCGTLNRTDAPRCNNCKRMLQGPLRKPKGPSLAQQATAKQICADCGKANRANATTCGSCGEPIGNCERKGRLVVVERFPNAIDAHLARTKLEASGISSVVYDENLISLHPVYSAVMGGVGLAVWASDIEKAHRMLKATKDMKLWGGFNIGPLVDFTPNLKTRITPNDYRDPGGTKVNWAGYFKAIFFNALSMLRKALILLVCILIMFGFL